MEDLEELDTNIEDEEYFDDDENDEDFDEDDDCEGEECRLPKCTQPKKVSLTSFRKSLRTVWSSKTKATGYL